MTDYFALLNVPRRPWLESESLKARFLELAARTHPDRVHHLGETERCAANARYAELTSAFRCLAEPKDRLLHLLMLETGSKPSVIQDVPADMMGLFLEVGQACRNANCFLERKSRVASPLLRAQLYPEGLEWMDRLKAIQQKLTEKQSEVISELKAMNADWEQAYLVDGQPGQGQLPSERLETLHRLLSFLHRWSEQVTEGLVKLTL